MGENLNKGHRQRMYARYDKNGLEGFSEHEILEMLLFYAIPLKNTNDIAHRLLQKYGSIPNILNKPAERLATVGGIGEAAGRYLNFLGEVYNSLSRVKPPKKLTPETAKEYFVSLFKGKTHEEFYMVGLDPKDDILVCKRLSVGGFDSANADTALVMKTALDYDCAQVIFVHNHPSGIAVASDEDINLTRILRAALSIAGIKMRDHVIVAGDKCVSILANYRIKSDRTFR